MYKKILFADDLSKRAIKPLAAAVDLAKLYNAELLILNVREDFLNKEEMLMLRVDVSNFHDDIKKQALEIRNKIEMDSDTCGGSEVQTEILLREGKPPDTICEVAREKDVDLIIVGTRGSSILKETLLGSTAHYVVNHAKRSVLSVWTGEEKE